MTVTGPRWDVSERDDCLVLRPDGLLDAVSYRLFRDSLVKFAMGQPRAIIVELDQLTVAPDSAWTAFSSARMVIGDWPGVPILLVATSAVRRAGYRRGTVSQFIPIFADVPAAVAAAGEPPARRRAAVELVPVSSSSRQARAFVHAICQWWDLVELDRAAAEVTTELVENSILHAGTDMRLRLEYRKGMLTVAVSDHSPAPAVLHEAGADGRTGLGLHLVAAEANVWGCAPELFGGKTVWAVLTTAARHCYAR